MVSVLGIVMVMSMEITIGIDGMNCKSCKSLIEGEVSEIDDVYSINVSLKDANAMVMLRKDCTEQIVSTINSLGFSAKVLR